MTTVNDFDFDVMQKKNIARGAYHRKGGSKSKKCSLPSDLLTPAQKRALNGPVTTVKLGQPMSWEAYKSLSDTLKKEYLEDLIASYQVNGAEIGRMLGVSVATMSRELRGIGVSPFKGSFGKETQTHKAHRARKRYGNRRCRGRRWSQVNPTRGQNRKLYPSMQESRTKHRSPPKKAGLVHLRTTFDGVPNLKQLEDLFTLFVQLPREVTVTIEVTS